MKNHYVVKGLYAAAILFAGASTCHAGAYNVDASFATAGRHNLTYAGSDFRTLAHLARPDGTSLAIATYDNNGCPAGRHCFALYPFNAKGQEQSPIQVPSSHSFSKRTGGIVLDPYLVKAAAIDSQNRIVIAGTEQFGTVRQFKVIRLLANGQPDNSFDGDGIATPGNFTSLNQDLAEAMSIDSSDRIVLAGSTAYSATDTDFLVVRFTTAGALDTSFASTGRVIIPFDLSGAAIDRATAVEHRNGGQIYVAGVATDVGISRIGLVKLLPSGNFDLNFCPTTCTYQGPYTNINNGKRVLYYGSYSDNANDLVTSLAVNISGEMAYAGVHQTGASTFRVFTQTVALNGDYANEGLTSVGLADPLQYSVGGIRYFKPNSSSSNLVLTGSVGPNREYFFAQGLNSALVPLSNWGGSGTNSSVLLYTASGAFGDNAGDLPAIPSVDASSRVLVGGSYKATSSDPNYSISIMRLSDGIFRNGFE